MKALANGFAELGVAIPEIYLPRAGTDLQKWAVIACDQYTSEEDYWKEVYHYVGDAPSALHLIFPEIYLEAGGAEERIKRIQETMERYLAENILTAEGPAFVYVERKTPYHKVRRGLLIAVDLEKYDYTKGAKSLIRATEGTIIERIPPRVKIREGAPLELPHIMLLIDDPERLTIEPLSEATGSLTKLYDFDLMMKSGHLTGYKVDDKRFLSGILEGLQRLADPEGFKRKYSVDEPPLLFAVGDGNHSLATAKAVWEKIKKSARRREEIVHHPARYALVEVVNLYDEGLVFEPIHRVLFNVDPDLVLNELKKYYECRVEYLPGGSNMDSYLKRAGRERGQIIGFTFQRKNGLITILNPSSNLAVGTLQVFLDHFLQGRPGVRIDYIHGAEVVFELGTREKSLGFYLPAMDKKELFRTVILDGALPRKTFSLGEAAEKRFYLECRKITV